MIDNLKKIKSYCACCRFKTNHTIIFSTEKSFRSDDFNSSTIYEVIECDGCNGISFRKKYSDDTMLTGGDDDGNYNYYDEIDIYPSVLEDHKILSGYYYIPAKIRTVYLESIEAFKAKSYLLTGLGLRTIIEAICLEEGIKGKDLAEKIKNLLKSKLITEKEEKRLHPIRFIGNDSGHEINVPSEKKLYIALYIIEHSH